jgi:hypothetical protein
MHYKIDLDWKRRANCHLEYGRPIKGPLFSRSQTEILAAKLLLHLLCRSSPSDLKCDVGVITGFRLRLLSD